MGKKHTRDLTRTAVRIWCSRSFNPWYGEATQYCTSRCRSQAAMARINGKAPDTTLPPTRQAVQPTPLTPQTETSKSAALPVPSPATRTTVEELGQEWRTSGQHWEAVAAWLHERAASAAKREANRFAETGRQMIAHEGRVLVLHGYGAGLFVKNGCLLVRHGRVFSDQIVADETLPRGEHGVSTLVWVTNGGAGSLSIQAIKWLARQAITLVLLNERGNVLGMIHPTPDSPTALDIAGRDHRLVSRSDIVLRRAQYGLQLERQATIARHLITRKVAAQIDMLKKHPELPDRARGIAAASMALDWLQLEPPTPLLSTLEGIRLVESRAARGYYASWVGLPLHADASAHRRWPAGWLTVAERYSPLTRWHSPRHAINPGQSMLNWLFGCLESQVRGALNAYGFDTAVGILHADLPNRDSLVYDIMEPLRGSLEERYLSFLDQHTFSVGDFQARSDGSVAIHPSLCRVLTELCHLPQRRVDDEARWLRSLLLGKTTATVASEEDEITETD